MSGKRIVVIGGSGRIGARLVHLLRSEGHEAVAASRATGVDVVTGRGLDAALTGAEVAVDVTEAPAFDGRTALRFFTAASRTLLAAEAAAGVRHHVALSVIGADRVRSGYFRGKAAQEALIRASGMPYTIVRAAPFFGLIQHLVHARPHAQAVRVPPATIQPVAPDDVAEALADVAAGPPRNGIVELAGDEAIGLDEFVRLILAAEVDPRRFVADRHARFFGAELDPGSLVPAPGAQLGAATLRDWLRQFITAD
jgi:uncharacterized protein YbjT (DUF2867 family)